MKARKTAETAGRYTAAAMDKAPERVENINKTKWKRLTTTLGKLFIDLGKLAFGSMVLGTVLKGDVDLFRMFMFGVVSTILFCIIGVWAITISEE